ncbi:unnamed protein product [Vicia faba]|uniref:Uncharacterized protein n=1 Tax=Vicia faba TaxID=3906 RepID=A0AAV1AJ04_VICFA|nr:unnamed protein product [Vicia faba]
MYISAGNILTTNAYIFHNNLTYGKIVYLAGQHQQQKTLIPEPKHVPLLRVRSQIALSSVTHGKAREEQIQLSDEALVGEEKHNEFPKNQELGRGKREKRASVKLTELVSG